jgi:isopenicillin N synthase-like dioxygenase
MPPKEKIASLAIVDYEALANKDVGEIQKLVQACQTVGMFYLNLRDSRMDAVFEDIPTIFKTGQAFFNLPHDSEEKTQSLREGMERGYEKMITSEASGSY